MKISIISGTWNSQGQVLPVKTEMKKAMRKLFLFPSHQITASLWTKWAHILPSPSFAGDVKSAKSDALQVASELFYCCSSHPMPDST